MDSLRVDLAHARRGLRRNPLFSVAVILTLAVAIGSATAVIAVVYGVLLAPLPIRDQERIAVLRREHSSGDGVLVGLSVSDLVGYAAETRTLEAVAGVQYDGAGRTYLRDGDHTFPVGMVAVSGDFFRVLGTRPRFGRLLNSRDDVVGGAMVVVISDDVWRREFGGDTSVVGRKLRAPTSDVPMTVVGVMPPGFAFPVGAQMWIPALTILPDAATGQLALYNLVGRLRPNATREAASSELSVFLSQRPHKANELRDLRVGVRTIASLIVGEVRPVLVVLASVIGLLLLIAVANVASLFLVRGVERQRELAVRAAIGAGRARLVKQLAIESLAFAALGWAAGVLLAWELLRALVALAPVGLPRLDNIHINPVVLVAAGALASVAAVAFGLIPALLATRTDDLMRSLRAGSRALTGARAARLGGNAVVIVQVALAFVVVISAGLLGRTLLRLQSVDPGYAATQLTAAELELPASLETPAAQQAFNDQLIARMNALPSVSSATLVLVPPYAGARGWDTFYSLEGQTPSVATANPSADFQAVLPNYFTTLGIPIERGRGIIADDRKGAVPVVVISEGLARRAWPGQDPLGKRLKFGGAASQSPWYEVVGVARDTRYRELATLRPVVFVAWAQVPTNPLTLLVTRGRDGKSPLLSEIRRVVGEVDRRVAVTSVSRVEQMVSVVLARPRFNTLVVAVFAAIAVLIAALGVYAVMSTFVRQRIPELGVRMALGAEPRDVRRLVFGRGFALVGGGMGCGLALSLAGTRLLQGMLYEISPIDPLTIVASSAMTLAIAAVACYGPARRAGSVDPLVALRFE